MVNMAIRAKMGWQERAWPAPEKTWQEPFEFKVSESEPIAFVTTTNDLGAYLESGYERVQYWASNWDTPTNTSGTIPATLAISGEPRVVFICSRNECNRPWLDELSEIQLPTLKVFGERSATGLASVAEPLTWEVKRPVAPSRQREIEWLSINIEKLHVYQGNWIALEGDKIVAWGLDEIDVETQAKMKGVKAPLLFRVPAKTDKPFIGHRLHDCSSIR